MGIDFVTSKERLDFRDLALLHRNFPQVLYPAFRLQISMMRNSLGEYWWSNKKLKLTEERKAKKKLAEKNLVVDDKKLTEDEAEAALEKKTREMMGWKYYGTPWKRNITRMKIKKMEAIEEELNRKAKFGIDNIEEDEDF